MTQLQPGDKVRLTRKLYVTDSLDKVYYVKSVRYFGSAMLTNRSDLQIEEHTQNSQGDTCYFYGVYSFEPVSSLGLKKKGFVSFIRKLEGVS